MFTEKLCCNMDQITQLTVMKTIFSKICKQLKKSDGINNLLEWPIIYYIVCKIAGRNCTKGLISYISL